MNATIDHAKLARMNLAMALGRMGRLTEFMSDLIDTGEVK